MLVPHLREAAQRWLGKQDELELVKLVEEALTQKHTLTEISSYTGIKRTTLYYLVYGKDGKNGRESA
jgi:hypothetical protein